MQSGRTNRQEIRNDQATISQKSNPNIFVEDRQFRTGQRARTVADHFASCVMSTHRHLTAIL